MKLLKALLIAAILSIAPIHSAHAVLVCLQWIKGSQFFDANGNPLAAGDIFIQDAGTTSLRTTYSDKDGSIANTYTSSRIVLDSGGKLDESVYIPTGNWKYTLRDSGGTTVETEDNIKGCLDTSAFLTGSVTAETPVIAKTADYTIVNGDQTKVINANSTGGAITLTLPSAVTVGDGWRITVRHTGTANQVTIATVSSQTIDGASTRVLSTQYESVTLVSDGSNWHASEFGLTALTHGRFIGRLSQNIGPPQQMVIPFAQVRLAKSGSDLVLSPRDGNLLTINSAAEVVPDSGVTLTTSGLSNATLYYVYAYMSGSTMALEGSTTAYATQNGTGLKIKSGDATRSLVGMAYLTASAFTDSSTQRFVRSYYNDPGPILLNNFTSDRTTTSTSFVELHTEIRVEFIVWTDEIVRIYTNGTTFNGSDNHTTYTSVGIDDTTAEDAVTAAAGGVNSVRGGSISLDKSGLTEGYHYVTVLGKVSSDTGTWDGGSTAGERFTLGARLRR